jgi:hypothetical protein
MFKVAQIINKESNAPVAFKLPATASVAFKRGELVSIASGKVAKTAAKAKPTHITLQAHAADTNGGEILVAMLTPETILETTFSAAPTSIVNGSVVTLATDNLSVTATTTDGVVTIFDMNGAAAKDDKVYVHIV